MALLARSSAAPLAHRSARAGSMQQGRIEAVHIMGHSCHRWHAAMCGGACRSWVRPAICTSEKDMHPQKSLHHRKNVVVSRPLVPKLWQAKLGVFVLIEKPW